MKLQQLRYILEVVRNNLNISDAAEVLFTSQPGISKQIRLLEEELGVPIFVRNGKRIVSVSEPGVAVIRVAEQIMIQAQTIKRIGDDFAYVNEGELKIAASYSQARHLLPKVVSQFSKNFPKVSLVIRQGSPAEVQEMVLQGEVDFAIVSEELGAFKELAVLPCYDWFYNVIVPKNHPLLDNDIITLKGIVDYPLVTYESAFSPQSKLFKSFQKEALTPLISLLTVDCDVIKTYVRLGLGVGVVESVAFVPDQDNDLHQIDVSHLFGNFMAKIAIRKDGYLRGYVYHFIELLAPQLTREQIENALYAPPEPYFVEDFVI